LLVMLPACFCSNCHVRPLPTTGPKSTIDYVTVPQCEAAAAAALGGPKLDEKIEQREFESLAVKRLPQKLTVLPLKLSLPLVTGEGEVNVTRKPRENGNGADRQHHLQQERQQQQASSPVMSCSGFDEVHEQIISLSTTPHHWE